MFAGCFAAGQSTWTGALRQNGAAMRIQLSCASHPYATDTQSIRSALRRINFCAGFRSLLATALLLFPLSGLCTQSTEQSASGLAWRVIGAWHVKGESRQLSNGDAVAPRALLIPEAGAGNHSITILLPDGQRVLYECFAADDCARGFRVPALYRAPVAAASDLLARVHAVFQRSGEHAQVDEDPSMARDEAVAALGPDNKVEIAGLAAALSNGTYSYSVQSVSRSAERQAAKSFEKNARSISLTVPSDGLYEVTISDRLKTPRIELLVAAVRSPRAQSMTKSFQQVSELLKDWNEDYQGWPVHDIKRAYLRSLMLGINPLPGPARRSKSATPHHDDAEATAEPAFLPAPGIFKSDTQVTLQCATPGATMHYTVDGSQPLKGSDVYRAPIMVKGTELTIKAFASAPGKKDSPVVTGIFRIGE